MLAELRGEERQRIVPLIINSHHELSIRSVVFGSAPGEVWVDDVKRPHCGIIKTPECNVLFGQSTSEQTNAALFDKVGYFETVTCDTAFWDPLVMRLHRNSAIRRYTRVALTLYKEDLVTKPDESPAQLLRYGDYGKIDHQNREVVLDWIHLQHQPANLCVAAIIVRDNRIVSCAALDCTHEDRAEIGIKTMEGFRKLGLGRSCVTALTRQLFAEGLAQVGWHCAATNKGSIRLAQAVGFSRRIEYEAWSPFPPIENVGDIDAAGWAEYAAFFEERAVHNANHYWQAAKCWAKARNSSRSISCIHQLIDKDLLWFRDYIEESAEFAPFIDSPDFVSLMKRVSPTSGSSR